MAKDYDSIQNRVLSDILKNYPKEFHEILLKKMPGFSVKDDDETALVLGNILGKSESADKFLEIFDEHKDKGIVHIFFYRLDDKEYLERLRDERNLKKILPETARNLINKKILIWDSPAPTLVNIRHSFQNGHGELAFKWVESRMWDERESKGTIDSPPYYDRRKERSVNYFIIDLNEGIAQMRIQLIKPNALQSLKGEYDIFLEEIEKLLDFKKFRRIALESVAKSFLFDETITQKTWELWLPEGGCFTAKDKPAKYIKFGFKLKLITFFVRKLNFDYKPKKRIWGPPVVRLKLDGEKDILTINNYCDQEQMTEIINKVLIIKENKIGDKIISNSVKNELLINSIRIAISFDYHFRLFKNKKVTAGHLIDSEWLQRDGVLNAMNLLGDNFPDNFDKKGSGKNLTLTRIS